MDVPATLCPKPPHITARDWNGVAETLVHNGAIMFFDECNEAIWEEGCVSTYWRDVGKKEGSSREDVGSGKAEEEE